MGLQHRPDMHENVIQVIFPQTAQTIWFINRRFTLVLHYSNKANLRVCMHCLESQPYCYIKWPIGILPKTSITNYSIYGNHIKGMPYQNALFLANLESLKDRRIKLSQSFFKKILSTDSCLHTLLSPERNNEIFSKLRNPLKYEYHTLELKNTSPSLTMPLPTSRTVCDLYFIVHFIFHIANCLLCTTRYLISCVFIVS